MSYSLTAERYARGATPMTLKPGYALPAGWCLFDQVYSEIADATPLQGIWKTSGLIGKCPSIAHYATSTQGEILRVVLRDMAALPPEADGIKRYPSGWSWRIAVGPQQPGASDSDITEQEPQRLANHSTPDLERRLNRWKRDAAGGPLADLAPASIAAIEMELKVRQAASLEGESA